MKIAFIIQCHKDPVLLNLLIKDILLYEKSSIYLHIDKTSSIKSEDIISHDRVFILEKRVDVRWGTFSQIEATLLILKEVYGSKYDYVNFISGQDFLNCAIDDFVSFLQHNKGSEFIEFSKLPKKEWKYEGGLGRLKYHWIDRFTPNRSFIGRLSRNLYLYSSRMFYNKDIQILGTVYGGPCWFTITGKLAGYIVDFVDKHPNYIKLYKNSGCADEIFFQTLILNSPFQNNVVNNNLRYIKWKEGKSSPEILTLDDFVEIKDSNKFFIRKVDLISSRSLLSALEKTK